LLTVAALVILTARSAARPGAQVNTSAAAVQASPELVKALSSEIGGTPEQAAGAAGAPFGPAESPPQAGDLLANLEAVPGVGALGEGGALVRESRRRRRSGLVGALRSGRRRFRGGWRVFEARSQTRDGAHGSLGAGRVRHQVGRRRCWKPAGRRAQMRRRT